MWGCPTLVGFPLLVGLLPPNLGFPSLECGSLPPLPGKMLGDGGGGSHQGAGGLRVGVGRGGVPELRE